jgi:hypothetical protein
VIKQIKGDKWARHEICVGEYVQNFRRKTEGKRLLRRFGLHMRMILEGSFK